MTVIPTEPSNPRPRDLRQALDAITPDDPALDRIYDPALRDAAFAEIRARVVGTRLALDTLAR